MGDKQADGLPSAKPQKYRAPSWTWASVDANIISGFRLLTNSIAMIRVEDANVQPLTNDPTGQVCGGHIRLRGMIAKAEFRAEPLNEGVWGNVIRFGNIKTGARVSPDSWTQTGTDVPHWQQGCFLLVTQSPDSSKGLLLHPVDETETKFERCGYFNIGEMKLAHEMFGLKTAEPGQHAWNAWFADPTALRTITTI
jgi:hypothetical protein